jgi:membrane-associated phospholipid phosphatase
VRWLVVLALLVASPAAAQPRPVNEWADWSSYGTALGNPMNVALQAIRDRKWCELGRLGIQEGVGNGVTLGIKHTVTSSRPCAGCPPDGFPSGHTMNAGIGADAARWGFGDRWKDWIVSAGLVFLTGLLRHEANRHYWYQIGAGAAVAVGADAAGYLLHCP